MVPSPQRRLLLLSAAVVLAACAGTPPPATVQVFTWPLQLPAGSGYRYERLPSQAAQPSQNELEAAADALLARAGLRRDDVSPRLAVQLTARRDPGSYGYGPWDAPYGGGPTVGVGVAGGSGGVGGIGIGLGFPIGGSGARPAQRLDVQIRDLASGQVVFQSQASGSAGTSPVALLRASLRDFPNARPGTRQVPLDDAASR
ncbi:DUF4136 domain-containing protein [Ramlibacter tataouinensis]|uniref:DUF4136 domain-containing protein n=1 Tax=Ramlibacter tataouinensis TaxID=94132 RepID=UPI0022F38ACC|nr:DUF4136 domain-containing protein [Ramlibacter tataouinensis]WBY01410.1 DUF4136 domain-containing protein [Ramlibacter tataouinensis]